MLKGVSSLFIRDGRMREEKRQNDRKAAEPVPSLTKEPLCFVPEESEGFYQLGT